MYLTDQSPLFATRAVHCKVFFHLMTYELFIELTVGLRVHSSRKTKFSPWTKLICNENQGKSGHLNNDLTV